MKKWVSLLIHAADMQLLKHNDIKCAPSMYTLSKKMHWVLPTHDVAIVLGFLATFHLSLGVAPEQGIPNTSRGCDPCHQYPCMH